MHKSVFTCLNFLFFLFLKSAFVVATLFKFCCLFVCFCVFTVQFRCLSVFRSGSSSLCRSTGVHPPAHPSTCKQTVAQSVDATSFDMVKQYSTSSLFLFAHLQRRCHQQCIMLLWRGKKYLQKKKKKSVDVCVLQRLISALPSNKQCSELISFYIPRLYDVERGRAEGHGCI